MLGAIKLNPYSVVSVAYSYSPGCELVRVLVTGDIFQHLLRYFVNCTVKKKAIPLQTWTGPEGSRRLRLPDFKEIGT
jgi:hypothetical protein